MSVEGGGVGGNQFLTFDAESKFAKIPNSHVLWRGGGVGGNQFPTFDAQSKFAKIPNSHVCGGGGVGGNQFLTFDAESKFAKIPNSHVLWRGGGVGGNQFPTFDAESKFVKILKHSYKGVCWKFSKFSDKKVAGNGFGLWVPSGSRIRSIRKPQQFTDYKMQMLREVFIPGSIFDQGKFCPRVLLTKTSTNHLLSFTSLGLFAKTIKHANPSRKETVAQKHHSQL